MVKAEIRKKKKKRKFVPMLRFKEFEGKHITQVFDEIVKVIDCKHRTPPYVEEGIAVVSPGSIKWGNIDLISPKKRVSDEEYESLMDHCTPSIGDLVFSRNQSIGVASIIRNEEKFVLGQDTVLIQAKKINSIYNYFRLQTHSVQNSISRLSGGSTFSRINLKDLRKLKVTVADSTTEQKKIATFLSAIDKKIQQLTRKKEALIQYKKGVMQQLFSGQLRFKDEKGKDFPEWEEKRFIDVATFINGKAFKQSELLSEGKYRVLRVGNLFSNKNWYHSDLELKEDKYIDKGDLIYAWSASFGPRFWEEEKVIYHYHIWKVIPNHNVDKHYLFHAFMSDIEKIKAQSQGGTMFHITKGNIESRVFKFPCIEEQIKIAGFLNNLDQRIEQATTQITQTQTFKKGLLQKLFV